MRCEGGLGGYEGHGWILRWFVIVFSLWEDVPRMRSVICYLYEMNGERTSYELASGVRKIGSNYYIYHRRRMNATTLRNGTSNLVESEILS